MKKILINEQSHNSVQSDSFVGYALSLFAIILVALHILAVFVINALL